MNTLHPSSLTETGTGQEAVEAQAVRPASGEQLDRGLAHDRRLRQAESELAQARIDSAHRAETWLRSACVVVGLLPALLLLLDAGTAAGTFGDEAGALSRFAGAAFSSILVLVMWILPALATGAVVAWRWRLHLLRTATEQEFAVRDPGRMDYR